MESQQHNATKEPEIELFVKVGLGRDGCALVVRHRLILPRLQLGVGGGNSWVSSCFGRLQMGTKFEISRHEGWLSGCPQERTRHVVVRGLVGCHAQHPRRCPGLVVVAYPGGMALLAAGVRKERAHMHLSKPR